MSVFHDTFKSVVDISGSVSLIDNNRTESPENSYLQKKFAILVCACSVMWIFGNLIFSLSVLDVIAVWTESMCDAGLPYHEKLLRFMSHAIAVFKGLYTILSLGHLVSAALATFFSRSALSAMIALDFTQVICNHSMLLIILWAIISIRKAQDGAVLVKRNQLIRILFLVLFQTATLYNHAPYYIRIAGAVFWVLECLLLMWPKTLVHLEIPPMKSVFR